MNRRVGCARRGTVAAAVTLGIVAAMAPLAAMEPRALPPFQVQAPDGTYAGAGQVALAGRQILIYVDADCGTCALILTALDGLDAAVVTGAVTLVVRGDTYSAAAFMGKAPASLSGLRWFADSRRSAYTALKLQTTPTMLGLWGGRIHWAIPGAMADAAAVQSAVRSWLGPTAQARRQQ